MTPPQVIQLRVREFKTWLDEGRPFELLDVRTEWERDIVKLDRARLLDPDAVDWLMTLPRDTPLVFQCHHGIRSNAAAAHFLEQGFTRVYNLVGGIDAWSREIAPDVPRY